MTEHRAGECGGPVRLMLADDHVLLRSTLRMLFDAEPGIEVVGEAADGVEAVAVARQTRPDVVLMDIRMPRLDGIEATRQICADPALGATRVVVLTMVELDRHVHDALRAGASGFLLKDARPEVIVEAVHRAHAGESLLAPQVLGRVIAGFLDGAPRAPAPPEGLTARETDVLRQIGLGLSNAEIEQRLVISRGTVKTHISRLLTKLGARDRAQLVIAAYDAGLVTPRRHPSP